MTTASDLHRDAQTLLLQGATEAALDLLAQAHAADPQSVAILLDMAAAQQTLGRLAEATESWRRCTELQPDDGYMRELYTQALMDQWLRAMHGRRLGREASKSYAAKVYSGFFRTWLSGARVLDIGYRGAYGEAQPIVPQAVGVDLGYPGYDGVHLPFDDGSQDAVYSSHCLEHVADPAAVVREWLRVVRIGGYVVTVVPHQYLYERRVALPSAHPDHRHLFTPSTLLGVFEGALVPNTWRVRHLADNDLFYDYAIDPGQHPVGCYEIELVIEKIAPPTWGLTGPRV